MSDKLPAGLEHKITLTPRAQIDVIPNKLLAWVRACGAYIHHKNRWGDLPASLHLQHYYDLMVVHYDSVHYSGSYDIWQYYKHSSFHIKLWAYAELPDDCELLVIATLRGPSGYTSKVEAFEGSTKRDTEEWNGGDKNIGFTFDRPANGAAINIILRPTSTYPVALKEVNIFIF